MGAAILALAALRAFAAAKGCSRPSAAQCRSAADTSVPDLVEVSGSACSCRLALQTAATKSLHVCQTASAEVPLSLQTPPAPADTSHRSSRMRHTAAASCMPGAQNRDPGCRWPRLQACLISALVRGVR